LKKKKKKKFLYEIKGAFNDLNTKNEEELFLEIEKVKRNIKKNFFEKKREKSFLIHWFAIVQEIASRRIGLKHYESQLLAGLQLHAGKIVEMKTGEGKTLASTLPVSFNALTEKGVHVITVNDYLAERDQKWMGKVYQGLGLTVGLVKSTSTQIEKKKSYFSDITYVTNSELVFDYLRDSSAYNVDEIVQRPLYYAVLDEIDSILIDEARTPLILSTANENVDIIKLKIAKTLIKFLKKDFHFQVDEKRKDINLTEDGYEKIKEKLGKETLYDSEDPWILEILNALKAEYLFKKNKDYIVLNDKVMIVDEFTGRVMEDRRWSLGIHEAIECKENVEFGGGTKTKSSITYQNFFTLYPKLAGMTGTAKTAEKEFQDIYNLKVEVLKTSKPMIRQDLSDLVYQTELIKWKAVLKKAKECFQKGQPLLIGTASVEKSEFLSELFQLSEIPHQVLNAKPENVRRENEVIAQAGKPFAITIATNMAGRGTDIILGGNPNFEIKQKIISLLLNKDENSSLLVKKIFDEYEEKKLEEDVENLPYSLETSLPSLQVLYQQCSKEILLKWEKENFFVKSLGGLFVLGTERHETRRIDNQLRGRAGRQGDPGISQFYISLEDDLVKVFGGENIRNWVNYLLQDNEVPLESDLLTKSLENAQKKVEFYNYDLRKNVFQYDEVLNIQRNLLISTRNEILLEAVNNDFFLRYQEFFIDEEFFVSKKNKKGDQILTERFFEVYRKFNEKKRKCYQELWISFDLRISESNCYQTGFLKNTRAMQNLIVIDYFWTDHLERMSNLRETINWRSYGQENPLTEYNLESFQSLKLMFDQIRSSMLYYFLNKSMIEL